MRETETRDGFDVGVRVAGDVGDAFGEAVVHGEDAELGDGVLLEVFTDEVDGVTEGEDEAGGAEVFLCHRGREVEDEDEIPDDAALEGGFVFEESATLSAYEGEK